MGQKPLMLDYDFEESYYLSAIFSVSAFLTTLFASSAVRLYASMKADVTTSTLAAELPTIHAFYRAYKNRTAADIMRFVLTMGLVLLGLHNVALWGLSEKVIRLEHTTIPVFNGENGDLNITIRSSSTLYLATEGFDSTGENNVLMVRDATDIFYRNESSDGSTFTLDEYADKITGRYSELSFGRPGECAFYGNTQRCNLTRPDGSDFAEFISELDVVYNNDMGDTVTITIPSDTASVTTGITVTNWLKTGYADWYKAYYTVSEGSNGLLSSLLGGLLGNLTGAVLPESLRPDTTVRVTAEYEDSTLRMQLCGFVDASSQACAIVEAMSKRLDDRVITKDGIASTGIDVLYTALFSSSGFGSEQSDALNRADKLKRLYLSAVEPTGTGTKERAVVKFRFSALVFAPLVISLVLYLLLKLVTLSYLPHLSMSITEMLTLTLDGNHCLGKLKPEDTYANLYLTVTEPIKDAEGGVTKPGHIGITSTDKSLATKMLEEYKEYKGDIMP